MTVQNPIAPFPTCLDPLALETRWVVWRYETRKGKPTKPPLKAINGEATPYASSDDPSTWACLSDAQTAARCKGIEGIGLQLLNLAGFAALDLDNVREVGGDLLPWARDLIEASRSYAEWTPSGNGARILGRVPADFQRLHIGKTPHPDGGEFEVYSQPATGRYITLSGNRIDSAPDALADISAVILDLVDLKSRHDGRDDESQKQDATEAKMDFDGTAYADLAQWVRTCIEHGGSGDRSGDFQSVVNALRPRGWTIEAALKLFQDHPTGPASKYIAGNRLEDELRRSWAKASPPRDQRSPPRSTAGDDPVDLWGVFPAPDLPLGLLPAEIEEFALVQGEMMGADPAGLAIAALVTCAAAITDKIQLQVKRHDPNWRESARIWAALVGSPSTKKSPILSAATAPLCRLDGQMFRDWQRAVAAHNALPKEERASVAVPMQTRLRIEDATVEAAQMVLEGSTWGVMLLQDELSGFFGAMDKYGGGKAAQADRAFWLRAFNGGEFALNRVGRGSALIPNLSVCLLGGIQPEPIRKVAGDAQDDGLLQRLFPVVLKPATMGMDAPAPDVVRRYGALVEELHRLRPPGFGNMGTLTFDDGAQSIRRDLEARHLELQASEAISRKLASHIGKYDGLFARLCIIWHCIEGRDIDLPARITEGTAQRVAGFLHNFLLRHAAAFYGGILGLSDDHDRLQAIAGFILARKLQRVTNRDVQRGDRTMRGIKEADIRPLLEQLAALGWLERIEGPRPSSQPQWIVNSVVHRKFTERGALEAARREEARKAIAGLIEGKND